MSLVMVDQSSTKLATKPSHEISLDRPEASATVFPVYPAPCVVAPTSCSTLGVNGNSGGNCAALASTSCGITEEPLEPSLDKPLQSYAHLEFNMSSSTDEQKAAFMQATTRSSSLTPPLLGGATPAVTTDQQLSMPVTGDRHMFDKV
jgi:hypothetical protein